MIATVRRPWNHCRLAPALSPQPRRVGVAPSRRILIAECRDEVFARLAGDLSEAGYKVFRATSADQVPRIYGYAAADLVICSMHLPDASPWLVATKLKMCRPGARVWAYAAWASDDDQEWAAFSEIERVLYYRGDVFRLSRLIMKGLEWRAVASGRRL